MTFREELQALKTAAIDERKANSVLKAQEIYEECKVLLREKTKNGINSYNVSNLLIDVDTTEFDSEQLINELIDLLNDDGFEVNQYGEFSID